MAELIDISNEKFWDILFDEACVEGQQAERIKKELKTISTTETEIRAKAFSDLIEKIRGSLELPPLALDYIRIFAEQLKEE